MSDAEWREKLEFVMTENAQLREQLEFNQTPQVRFFLSSSTFVRFMKARTILIEEYEVEKVLCDFALY